MRKEKVYMPRRIPAVFVLGLLILCFTGSEWVAGQSGGPQVPPPPRPQPQRSIKIHDLPAFFREDWRFDHSQPNVNRPSEPEHPVVQGDVSDPNLEVRVYGDAVGTRTVLQPENRNTSPGGGEGLIYVMSLLCGTNLDRKDLSGKVVLGPSTHANCAITLRNRNNDVDLLREWPPSNGAPG